MKKLKELFSVLVEKAKAVVEFIFKDTKHLIISIVVILVILFIIGNITSARKDAQLRREAEERAALELEQQQANLPEESEDNPSSASDQLLLSSQGALKLKYGSVPEGYIWDYDGELFSLGDKSMSAEEVLYAYLNGLRTLDFSMVQKYSRDSVVVDTYSDYYDSKVKEYDYYDSFLRNMYKEVLLSMEVKGITDITVFAENKQVFSVKINILDLTEKDFWKEDIYDIYETLYMYSSDEDDSTKSEMYLYDYVTDYYKSGKAKTRDILVNLTLERYQDLDTGWLVSIDTDINDACTYSDGTLMVNYIQNMYYEEGINYMINKRLEQSEQESEEAESTEENESLEETDEGTYSDTIETDTSVSKIDPNVSPGSQGTTE